MKNIWRNEIFSDNLHCDVGDYRENLKPIVEKIEPTHRGVVMNKYDIVVMTRNTGGRKGTLNIIMKRMKRCKGGDAIATRVRR